MCREDDKEWISLHRKYLSRKAALELAYLRGDSIDSLCEIASHCFIWRRGSFELARDRIAGIQAGIRPGLIFDDWEREFRQAIRQYAAVLPDRDSITLLLAAGMTDAPSLAAVVKVDHDPVSPLHGAA